MSGIRWYMYIVHVEDFLILVVDGSRVVKWQWCPMGGVPLQSGVLMLGNEALSTQ